MEVTPGYKFSESDFDLSKVEGRTIGGFKVYLEDGSLKGTYNFDNFATSKENLIIEPYFTSPEGFTSLLLGSGANSRYNMDEVPGSITENKTIKIIDDVFVHGGNNGYVENGTEIVETSPITIGSALRFDSKSSIIDSTATYEFSYNFENYGTSELHLDVYQISASAEYKGKYDYESRYRIDIDLKAGESTSVTGEYLLAKNGNALTYIVADRSMPNGMDFAMTIAMRKTDKEAPSTISKPEESAKGKVNLSLPENFSVASSYEREQVAGTKLTLPSEKEITNNTGKELEGWYVVDSNPLEFVNENTLVDDLKEITIAPYFASSYGESLIPGSSSKNNLPDYAGTVSEDGTLKDDETFEAKFNAKGVIVNSERGINISYDGALNNNNFFRLLTSSGKEEIKEGYTYSFKYTLKNNASTPLTLAIYQVHSGLDLTGASISEDITLKANETKDVEINFKANKTNKNLMSIFMIKSSDTNLNLDILLAKKLDAIAPTQKVTLTLGGSADVSFNGAKSVELDAGATLPELTNNTKRTLLGFYDETGKRTLLADYKAPSTSETIYPYFDYEEGYTPLFAASGQSNHAPQSFDGCGIDAAGWNNNGSGKAGYTNTKDSAKVIVKGKDGLDEIGLDLIYSKTMAKGNYFRLSTALKDKLNAGTHTFNFNFENKGESKISFEVYQVNSGTDKASTSGDNHFTLTLLPGEATSIKVSPTYAKSNGNALSLFTVLEDVTSPLKLGVSMSVKYNTK